MLTKPLIIVLTIFELSTGFLEKATQVMVDHLVEESANGTMVMATNTSSSTGTSASAGSAPDSGTSVNIYFFNFVCQNA